MSVLEIGVRFEIPGFEFDGGLWHRRPISKDPIGVVESAPGKYQLSKDAQYEILWGIGDRGGSEPGVAFSEIESTAQKLSATLGPDEISELREVVVRPLEPEPRGSLMVDQAASYVVLRSGKYGIEVFNPPPTSQDVLNHVKECYERVLQG